MTISSITPPSSFPTNPSKKQEKNTNNNDFMSLLSSTSAELNQATRAQKTMTNQTHNPTQS
jgi:hypothetical protein